MFESNLHYDTRCCLIISLFYITTTFNMQETLFLFWNRKFFLYIGTCSLDPSSIHPINRGVNARARARLCVCVVVVVVASRKRSTRGWAGPPLREFTRKPRPLAHGIEHL